MTMPTGHGMSARSIVAGLAVGLALVAGCGPEGVPADSSTKAPPNPAPRSDLGVTVAPRVPKDVPDHDPNTPTAAEKQLHKAQAVPSPKSDATTNLPPAGKPDAAGTGAP
jgi:hypothetical protein